MLPQSKIAELPEQSGTEESDITQDVLQKYLNWSWGYRADTHVLSYDNTIELNGIDFYAFRVSSIAGEYENTFAISIDEQMVLIYDAPTGEWVEDRNPDPWPGW